MTLATTTGGRSCKLSKWPSYVLCALALVCTSPSPLLIPPKHRLQSVGSLDLHFSGGLSGDILNFLKRFFSSSIRDEIQSELTSQLRNFVDDTVNNQLLGNISLALPLPFPAPFDIASLLYNLTRAPVVQPTYVGVGLVGRVFNRAHAAATRFIPNPLPNFTANAAGHYAELFLSSFMFETAGEVFVDAGLCHVSVSSLPPSIPLKLNTASFAAVAPGLAKAYPSAPMRLDLGVVSYPSFVTDPAAGAANVSFDAVVNFTVLPDAGPPVVAFAIGGLLSASFDASISGGTGAPFLAAKLGLQHFPVSLRSSSVGAVAITGDVQAVMEVLANAVLDAANTHLQSGIPLPAVAGLALRNSEIFVGDGYLLVGTDFSYDPEF